jgi:hypothetical protein
VDRPQTIIATRSRTASWALAFLLLVDGCTSGIDLLGDGDHDGVPPADADGEVDADAYPDVPLVCTQLLCESGSRACCDPPLPGAWDPAIFACACPPSGPDADAVDDEGDGADADDADADAGTCVGGWFDPSSGLCWEDPPPSTAMDLSEAEAYCDALSLGDYGSGSWHLPTIDELRSLIRECPATEPGGACAVTDPWCLDNDFCMNDWCDGCSSMWGCYWPDPVSGPCSVFRSSSVGGDRFGACNFVVRFTNASVECGTSAHVRCVRRGP